jgi:murein L,D-transpeptidase YcbB/YkuD
LRFALAAILSLPAVTAHAQETTGTPPPAAAPSAAPPSAAPTPAAPPPIAPASPAATAPATLPTPAPGVDSPAAPEAPQVKAKAKPKHVPAPKPVALSQDPRPTLTPRTYELTLKAAARYQAIVAAGGWPSLPKGARYAPGAGGKPIATLKQRLAVEGDLRPDDALGEGFDAATREAVKRFQARHGLTPNGVVGPATLAAMNVPAEIRLRQIEASVQRLATSRFPFGERYVVVNIPSAAVEAVENGRVFRRYTAVAGDPAHHSPTVETRVTAVNFNPTWTVPTSIIKNEIIPKMRKDKGYLARQGLTLIGRDGNEVSPASIDWSGNAALAYTVRQPEGARNALGQIRIDMPNSMAVYMHDTPGKHAFSRADRFLSHGCVRVSDVRQFATWLLEGANPGWNRSRTDEAIAIGARKTVNLNTPVPVIWVYLTAYPLPDGTVQFRDDVYNLDTTGISPGQPPIASATPTGGLW